MIFTELNISDYNFYATRLTPPARQLYHACREALKRKQLTLDVAVTFSTLEALLPDVLMALDWGCPELFFLHKEVSYTQTPSGMKITFKSYYPLSEIDLMGQKIRTARDKIINSINGISEPYHQVMALNDLICQNIKYTGEYHLTGDCHSALVNKTARCEGIAKAAHLILKTLGYKVITGYGKGALDNKNREEHAWTLVEVGGKWYNFDFTWNICNTSNHFACPVYTFMPDVFFNLEHESELTYPECLDDTLLIWNRLNANITFRRDFEEARLIQKDEQALGVFHFEKAYEKAEIDALVPDWFYEELGGDAFAESYCYFYFETLNVLMLFFLNNIDG